MFIIILACINFINLSTAQAIRRSREVGVQKVLGSLKSQLVRQFLAEAILYTILATGLFGLSVYTAERRVKEIGIRKILGASVQSVVNLLSKEFLKLVVLSAIISFPVAWWLMSKWLNDFAYRVSMDGWVFLIAGALAIVIALVTVSFQAIRAATRNPATSLKME